MLGTIVLAAAFAVGPLPVVQEPERQPVTPIVDVVADVERLVAEWIADTSSSGRDRVAAQLVKLGAPVVPALQKLVDDRSPATALALGVLCRIGEPARPALPAILAVLRDREYVEPPGQPEHVRARDQLLEATRAAAWAAVELIPALVAIASDAEEKEWSRTAAVLALGEMGPEALPALTGFADRNTDPVVRRWTFRALQHLGPISTPALQPIADDASDPLQDFASTILLGFREAAGEQTRRDFYAAEIEKNPFDPKVRGWLMRAEERNDPDRPDPLIQATKKRWRERLASQPDGELAWSLAGLLEDQLHGNELGYCASLVYTPRERSGENHETLAAALRLAQAHAEKLTPTWQRATRGLAKLALLRGDWDGMNAQLAELGEPPIPAADRPWLAPPPKLWTDLAAHWQPCDESMRRGDCSYELRVEKDGHGVRGAHVLLRAKPPETNVWSSGIDVHTLFHDSSPIGRGWKEQPAGFGYEGDDRERCRYIVTGDDGVARFEQLPAIEIRIEVMIPTANFEETWSRWDLFVEKPDGTLELDHYRGDEGVQLVAGATVAGPRLVVRPHLALNVTAGAALTPTTELTWPAWPGVGPEVVVRYEVELALSFPFGMAIESRPEFMSRLASATVETSGRSWPIGTQGVGDVRLAPGNVYLLQVTAKDAEGGLLGSYGRIWCYVPWSHRTSPSPAFRDGSRGIVNDDDLAPIQAELWYLGEFHDSRRATVETLPERLDRFLRERPEAFDVEYVRVARAWLRWRDGESDAARAELAELAQLLPDGNVAGNTARDLVRRIDARADPGQQLRFAAALKRD